MLNSHAPSETLAHWRYAPDEWKEFTGHERESNRFYLADTLTKYFNVLMVVGAVAVVFGALAGGIAGAFIIAVIVGGFLLLVTLFHRGMQMYAQSRLEAVVGEVFVTRDGVWTNGMWFGWGARDPAWRLRTVRRETISAGVGRPMEVLEFKCVGSVPARGGRVPVDKSWRVPVPAGKEAEAEAVVTQLLAAQHSPAREAGDPHALTLTPGPRAPDGLAEHDFAGGVCRRCGSTVGAVAAFKWKCRG